MTPVCRRCCLYRESSYYHLLKTCKTAIPFLYVTCMTYFCQKHDYDLHFILIFTITINIFPLHGMKFSMQINRSIFPILFDRSFMNIKLNPKISSKHPEIFDCKWPAPRTDKQCSSFLWYNALFPAFSCKMLYFLPFFI